MASALNSISSESFLTCFFLFFFSDMKALQSSLGKGVRSRGKLLTENFHNHSNKPSRPRGSLISGKGAYERGVGLNEDGGIFREGGGVGGGVH